MIEIVGDADFSEWDAYVERHPEATLYNLGGWGTVAEHAYGIHPYLILSRADAGAPLSGGLPLFIVSRLWTSYVTSGIFGAYGPILADDDGTRAELFEAARRFADGHRASHLHIKALGDGPTPPGFVRHDIWVTAKLPLSGGAEAAWHGLRKSSIRTKVHHAERAGLDVRWGKGNLDAFYDVLADNMHRKGSPIYGKRFMHELVGVFGERADIVTLWLGDQPISGALTLVHGGVMYAPFTSSRPAYFKLRPNNLALLAHDRARRRAGALRLRLRQLDAGREHAGLQAPLRPGRPAGGLLRVHTRGRAASPRARERRGAGGGRPLEADATQRGRRARARGLALHRLSSRCATPGRRGASPGSASRRRRQSSPAPRCWRPASISRA